MNTRYIIKSLITAFIIVLTACTRQEPQLLSEITIQFEMPESINDINIPQDKRVYADKEVRIKGAATEYVGQTDATGKVVFKNVFPDTYSISTSWQLSESEYNDLTNQNIQFEQGSSPLLAGNNPRVYLFENKEIKEKIVFSIIKSLIISKIYYAMSKSDQNKNYQTDGYIEIYNNSSNSMSLNGLHVGYTESLPEEQAFLAKDDNDFIYLNQVAKVPDGLTLDGYQSLVIALRSAVDHTQNAPNSVNLVYADLEIKKNDGDGNPAVKAAPVIHNASGSLQYFTPVNTGGNGYVIFKTDQNIGTWEAVPPRSKPNLTMRYLKVENRIIMDGVEILKYSSSGVNTQLKRLNSNIDATYTFNTGGNFSNEACERRVEKVEEIDGKTVYKLIDTNNSLNDFRMTKADIRPRIYDKPELMP